MIPEFNTRTGKFWTKGWMIVDGCTPVSEGCLHCWSAQMTNLWRKPLGLTDGPRFNGKINCRTDRLDEPSKWPAGQIVCVWNDLFHPDVPDGFIYDAWISMMKAKQHTFIVITKRPERAVRWINRHSLQTQNNIWFLGTAETQARLEERANHILQFPAVKRGIIIEPMLGQIDLRKHLFYKGPDGVPAYRVSVCTAKGQTTHCDDWWDEKGPCRHCGAVPVPLDWVICGVETGPYRRQCDIENVRSVVQQAQKANVPVWVKTVEVDGKLVKNLDELPEDLRVREMPV